VIFFLSVGWLGLGWVRMGWDVHGPGLGLGFVC
jgi:hypothetical protein